jgi:hypothetical protein
MPGKRPNPIRWLYYQFGGTLPITYREWVLHDITCRTWFLRVLLRAFVQMAPVMAVLVIFLRGVLGGPWPLVLGSILLGVLVYLRIALTMSVDSADFRLMRYGYPREHGSTVRRQAAKARETKR